MKNTIIRRGFDTCGCEVYQLWIDDGQNLTFVTYLSRDEAEAVNDARRSDPRFVTITKTEPLLPAIICPIHQNLRETTALFNTVDAENTNKNKAIAAIVNAIPTLLETVVDTSGNQVTQFKNGKMPRFAFDAQRNLQILLPSGLQPSDKIAADTQIAKLNLGLQITTTITNDSIATIQQS